MAERNYPYQAEMNVELINGEKRQPQIIIFTDSTSSHFFHDGKRYNVVRKTADSDTVLVTTVVEIPGENLPRQTQEPEHANPDT